MEDLYKNGYSKDMVEDIVEDVYGYKYCRHPSHDFPTHLYIEPGKSYTHTCPRCRLQITLTAPEITLQ